MLREKEIENEGKPEIEKKEGRKETMCRSANTQL